MAALPLFASMSEIKASENVQLPLFAGVDVGGTNIKVGLVDNAGQIVAATKFPTQQELGPQAAIDQARRVLDQLIDESS